MSTDILGLVIDSVMLIFLGAMIFYAMRLSENLKLFREQKSSFDGVIADLLSSIDQADRAIHNLKQVSSKESQELSDLVRKAKLLSEELKDVNQASESMASRLESLAEKNRKVMFQAETEHKAAPPPLKKFEADLRTVSKHADVQRDVHKKEVSRQDLPSFMIHDRDFEDLDSLGERLEGSRSNDAGAHTVSNDEDMPREFQSQAEKELYTALVTSKRSHRDQRGS